VKKSVRVVASACSAHGRSSHHEESFSFDLWIDENNRVFSGSAGVFCGFQGRVEGEPLWPMAYFPKEGKVDFGTLFSGQDRFYWTDLGTVQIRKGATFYLEPERGLHSPQHQLKIERIVPLP
jgi:hypothetical protein